MAGVDFSAIRDAMSAEQFARRELSMKGRRARCPFHGGTNFNLAFFDDGKCHCYKCGAGGDVVQLAAATWGLDQLDAARLLADELGISAGDAGGSWRDQRQRRQHERDQRGQEREQASRAWSRACNQEREARQRLAMFTAADADRPEFIKALRMLADAQTMLDLLWAGVTR